MVDDIDATVAFYRRLGLPIVDPGDDWPPGSGARHVEVETGDGVSLEFDNVIGASDVARRRARVGRVPAVVLGFALASRDAVDEVYAAVDRHGCHRPSGAPYDAFWGARYAVVADPDGNDVGLMSPKDPARRFTPDA